MYEGSVSHWLMGGFLTTHKSAVSKSTPNIIARNVSVINTLCKNKLKVSFYMENILKYCISCFTFNIVPVNVVKVGTDTTNKHTFQYTQNCYLTRGQLILPCVCIILLKKRKFIYCKFSWIRNYRELYCGCEQAIKQ